MAIEKKCFSGVMAAHDPSKVEIWVRLPALALMGTWCNGNLSDSRPEAGGSIPPVSIDV